MIFKFIFIEIFSVILLSYIVFKYFYLNTFGLNESDSTFENIGHSSVWCFGSDISERRCRFKNLCYKEDTKDFVFLFNDLSIKSGLPSDRFNPSLVELSSVRAHNKFYFNFIEIPLNAFYNNLTKVYKIEFLSGKTFIMSRFKSDNLMHYFHDDVIPLYFTLKEIDFKINSVFLFDDYLESFHLPFDRKIFENVFPKSFSRSELNHNSMYCMEEAFVGLSKSTTFYDYGFRSPQSPINKTKEESELISRTIRQMTKELMESMPPINCQTNAIIFISRQINRKIVNEETLIQFISNSTKLKVIQIKDLKNNFEDIIKSVFCSQMLIGVHGSGLILSQFLRPGSVLIELFPFGINPNYVTPYKTLTQLNEMNVHYFYWKNIFLNNSITHREYPKHFGGIKHLTHEEQETITSNNNDVPQHLCCDNPHFLYRMYSDTIVDINSFAQILDRALKQSMKPIVRENKLVEPGVVIGLKCERIEANGNHFISIYWSKPWNLNFVDVFQSEIKYEVLIQEVPSNTAKSLIVSGNQLSFLSKEDKVYNLWIRCKINNILGPFHINPLICSKQ